MTSRRKEIFFLRCVASACESLRPHSTSPHLHVIEYYPYRKYAERELDYYVFRCEHDDCGWANHVHIYLNSQDEFEATIKVNGEHLHYDFNQYEWIGHKLSLEQAPHCRDEDDNDLFSAYLNNCRERAFYIAFHIYSEIFKLRLKLGHENVELAKLLDQEGGCWIDSG